MTLLSTLKNQHGQIKTNDIGVINGYLYFVVIITEQNITKAVITVSEVNFLLQTGYTEAINMGKNQILPINNVIRFRILIMCLHLDKHDCIYVVFANAIQFTFICM